MSMNPEQDNFATLRRLLAWKRHEQPPPGYFHSFARQVIARIQAGERAEDAAVWGLFRGEMLWWQRLYGFFQAKPLVAGALGAAVCGLLIAAVIYSDAGGASAMAVPRGLVLSPAPQANLAYQQLATPVSPLFEAVAPADFAGTNGVMATLEKGPSLFEQMKPQAPGRPVRASWPDPGAN